MSPRRAKGRYPDSPVPMRTVGVGPGSRGSGTRHHGALACVPIDVVFVLGVEDNIGRFRAGKRADFTVLVADPFKEPVEAAEGHPGVGHGVRGVAVSGAMSAFVSRGLRARGRRTGVWRPHRDTCRQRRSMGYSAYPRECRHSTRVPRREGERARDPQTSRCGCFGGGTGGAARATAEPGRERSEPHRQRHRCIHRCGAKRRGRWHRRRGRRRSRQPTPGASGDWRRH